MQYGDNVDVKKEQKELVRRHEYCVTDLYRTQRVIVFTIYLSTSMVVKIRYLTGYLFSRIIFSKRMRLDIADFV